VLRGVVNVPARALGYLAFALAVAALSLAATLLGERHELGYFAGRLSESLRRYPAITHRGVQLAWLCWLVLFIVAVSAVDPIPSRWDEVVLIVLAVVVLWRRLFAGPRKRLRVRVCMAWLCWAALLAVALSDDDPISSRWDWDEAALVALAVAVLSRPLLARRSEH